MCVQYVAKPSLIPVTIITSIERFTKIIIQTLLQPRLLLNSPAIKCNKKLENGYNSSMHCTLRSWVHEMFSHFRTVSPGLGDNCFLHFMTFSPRLETNVALQCTSDSFPHMVIYILCVENCQNYISMHSCLPFAGRLFYNVSRLHGPRISECNMHIN